MANSSLVRPLDVVYCAMSLSDAVSEGDEPSGDRRDCIENCSAAARVCERCADACEECATECDRRDADHCQVCAEVLRECAESCQRTVES